VRRLSLLIAAALLGCSSGGAMKRDGGQDGGQKDGPLDTPPDGGIDTANDATSSDGGEPDTLTCDWLMGPSNCWTSTALMAMTCLPPATATGLLNANNSTCSYATSEVVTFTPPIALPPGTNMSWDFTINGANGRPCLHYQDTATGLTLVVGNQTVSETMYGTLGVRITCPDGTSVQTANATNLLGCPGGLVVLPGLQWSSSDTFVTTTLLGTGNTTLQLFDCRKN